ncbi:Nucleic acid-binding protein [Corchorus olitorius]|uniref:Nucleic acid-binding protein n=1 Tax=Corchorus olitorius TaxID=93759 RepID=A0A1R3J098_9ROSI|nr:Nucleic acid-binding protein [Corchorus olitorius]
MEPVELTIAQLNRGGNTNYIILRVARRWDTILPTTGKFITIDFLFTDRIGRAIHGYMDPKLQKNYSVVLFEGHVYKISTFQVKGLKSSHNAVPGPNKLLLYYSTIVTPVDIDITPFPRHHFNLATIDQIVARINKDQIMTGMLSATTTLNKIKVRRQEQEAKKRTVTLKLLSGGEVKVSIWAKFLANIDIDSLMVLQPKPIMLIAGTTVKGETSNFYLTTTTGSKIFINPDIPQTGELFQRYAEEKSAVILLEDDHPQQKKDDKAKIKLIIFETLAEELAGISVADVPALKDTSSIKIPTRAYDIINKQYYFVVGLPKHSLQKEELNFKIYDYKPLNDNNPSVTESKGKAIDFTSAPLLLTGNTTELTFQTPEKPTSAIHLPSGDSSPPETQ